MEGWAPAGHGPGSGQAELRVSGSVGGGGCRDRARPQLLTKESSEGDWDPGPAFSVSMSRYSVPEGEEEPEKRGRSFLVLLLEHYLFTDFREEGREQRENH